MRYHSEAAVDVHKKTNWIVVDSNSSSQITLNCVPVLNLSGLLFWLTRFTKKKKLNMDEIILVNIPRSVI